MRSAGDAPESVGEQTLNFRAIRDDDGPDRVTDEPETVRRADPSDDSDAEPSGDFFAFARPAAHDLPRTGDTEDGPDTLDPFDSDPEPAFETLAPVSDDSTPFGRAEPAVDNFAPFRDSTPARDSFTPYRAAEPASGTFTPFRSSMVGTHPESEEGRGDLETETASDATTDSPETEADSGTPGPVEADSSEAVADVAETEADASEGPAGQSAADLADTAETDTAETDVAETNDWDTCVSESDAETEGAAFDVLEADTPRAEGSEPEGLESEGVVSGGAESEGLESVDLEGEGSGGKEAGDDSGDAVSDEPVPPVPRQVVEEDLPDAAAEALTAALDALRDAVADLRFGLDLPGAEEARQAQEEILTQLRDYVLPRVRVSAAPALIVIAGSTGAGKSTLVNTLAEKNVSRTGVRRPTTGIPVLACHPDDRAWFSEGGLLGGLERIDRQSREAAPDSLVLVTTERLPQGVALLDTPDIDSVVEEHHEIARRMLDAADLWVFVTTASRYADAPAWNLLRLAKERAARIAIVLSRVQPKTRDVVVKHFVRMLTEYGLGEAERFVIEESAVTDGRLPDGEMTELRMWLAELSVDEERRAQAVQETLNGVLNSFRTRVPSLARYLEGQVAFRGELRMDVDAAYSGAMAHIESAVREGTLLRGEVRARWQDFAGSGDLTRSFQLRRKGRQVPPERITAFRAALRTALESLITSAAHQAADEVAARWRRRSELAAGLDRPSDDLARRTGRAVAAWQEHVTELLRVEGVTKRSLSKVVSLDAESLSLLFMVGLFSADELPHKLLKGLLGAEALRSISAKVLSDLRARIVMLFDEEAMRYVRALDAAGIPDEVAATRLYQATYNLEVAR
ncbi:hypothetical protein GCM10010404_69340 [Nonomuraea africana]|uniref:Energy-coupling factor transporter ATP-binding protein EcfA2 n=1 Tax=Nonomuraea africana TaxID=46171 RepID=A0ABR9K6X0_9ACTN|nr:GTPase [Nonomuraea africana]MBE1557759.1 energy-coupling factor transporter ATP-binding protein EcfA2 [Nonomuraea africana]